MNQRYQSRRGSALLITLAFVVIITSLMVGMAISMRLDRPAAASHLEKARATLFAQEGVDRVVARLRQYTGDPDRNWISGPGKLVVGAATDDPATKVDERKVLTTPVSLSSGKPLAPLNQSFLQPPNLNIATLQDPATNLITDLLDATDPEGKAKVAMRLNWVYVRQSGALDPSPVPKLTDQADPIAGRYAYWADDESSKVNYNVAWGRNINNTNPAGHPTKIDLTALTGMDQTAADALRSFVLSGGASTTGSALMILPTAPAGYSFFNSPEDARRVSPGVATALRASKFEVTHYNHDPDTTFFNEPRIVLTTRPDRAGWTYNTNTAYPNQWVGTNHLPWPQGRPLYVRILANEGTVVQPNYVPKVMTPPAVDPLDPGVLENIDAPNLNGKSTASNAHCRLTDAILMLALSPPLESWPAPGAPAGFQPGYMQRRDWPMITGTASIQDKYYGATGANYPDVTMANGANVRTDRLAQMAINIIEYVRCKESPQPIVPPVRASFSPTVSDPQSWFQYGVLFDDNAFMGTTRGPRVTELGLWMGPTTVDIPQTTLSGTRSTFIANKNPILAGSTVFKLKVELYLPASYGIDQIDLTKLDLWDTTNTAIRIDPVEIENPAAPSPTDAAHNLLEAGKYVTIVRTYPAGLPSTGPTRTKKYQLRVAIQGTGQQPVGSPLRGIRLDVTPINYLNAAYYILAPIDAEGVTEDNMSSVEVDDPRVNRHYKDWQPFSTPTNIVYSHHNTFGAANSVSSLKTPGYPTVTVGQPEQDTDSGGRISTVSLYMPPPAGTTFTRADGSVDDNTKGIVASPGELGFISTGVESCPQVTDTAGNVFAVPPGIPWRTLRFQPSAANTATVPDWAFMDLFSAPVYAPDKNAKYVYAPRETSVGGRVNMNAKAEPFGLLRDRPLAAVLQNATYDAANPTAKLSPAQAATIASNIYSRILAAGGKQYGFASAYDSPGEVVEMKGVADRGEASEELVRSISNLITARGDVFSIYSIGQALKQTADGKLVVTGEQRCQSIVERYVDTSVTPSAVNFAPVYFRKLNP